MSFPMHAGMYSAHVAAEARAKAAAEPPPPALRHAFEDQQQMQHRGRPAAQQPIPQNEAQYASQQPYYYGDMAGQRQQSEQQQQQQQYSHGQYAVDPMQAPQRRTGDGRRPRTPPRAPVAQYFGAIPSTTQNPNAVALCDVHLEKVHEKSKFLDHPSIPRFLHPYLEQELSRCPPSPPYICPVSRVSMRPTFETLPATSELADTLQLPLGFTFQPFAETQLPVVDFSALGGRIVRCRKCSAYINPFTTFCDSGRRWQCILCRQLNDVATEYFCPLDPNTGLRTDLLQRPELTRCSVDIYPTPEFLRRPPCRPAFLLMLDCSYQAIASGLLGVACAGALAALETMRDDDAIYMGVLGFASTIYFFNLRSTQQAPRVVVAPDIVNDVCNVDDNFKFETIELPCAINDLLVPVKDSYHLLKELFEKLPEMFASTKDVDCAYGPALAAAISILENGGGKIVSTVAAMPSVGEGKLKPRFDAAKMSNQPKEHTMLTPGNDWYKQRALACSNSNVSIDLIVSGGQELDLATIAPLARFTSGSIHRCTQLTYNSMADQVHRILTRYMAFEAILRVRTSNGLVIPNFYGHCHVREPDLLALPVGDADSSYSVQLQVGPALKSSFAYVQIAIVHTTRARERRIRVHTYQLGVSPQFSAVVNSGDSIGITCFLTKMAVDHAISSPFQQAQQRVMDRLISNLKAVKKHNDGLGVRSGHFSLPQSLIFVPQLLHGFFRHTAVGLAAGRPILPDARVAAMAMVMSTAPEAMLPYYVGWSFQIYSPQTPVEEMPTPIFSSQSFFNSDGVFLVHVGSTLVLWYGRRTNPYVLEALGLAHSADASPPADSPAVTNEQLEALRGRFNALVWHLREASKQACLVALEACPQGNGVFEPVLTQFMMEDEVRSVSSYTGFLREIWQKLSGTGK